MKFYIASHSGIASDKMSYEKIGGPQDLDALFPELIDIIDRYAFRTIDIRLTNGARLRIYDIEKRRRPNPLNVPVPQCPKITEESNHEKRAPIHS